MFKKYQTILKDFSLSMFVGGILSLVLLIVPAASMEVDDELTILDEAQNASLDKSNDDFMEIEDPNPLTQEREDELTLENEDQAEDEKIIELEDGIISPDMKEELMLSGESLENQDLAIDSGIINDMNQIVE